MKYVYKRRGLPLHMRIVAVVAALCVLGAVILIYSLTKNAHENREEVTADELITTAEVTTTAQVTTEVTTEETTEVTTEETTTVEPGRVSSIELDRYAVDLEVGEKEMPMVTMYPLDAENKGEKWESSDTSVATVNKYGNITGVAPGSCVVTVTSVDNPAVSAVVEVTVNGTKVDTSAAQPHYINGILVVNKTYPLPSDYNPGADATAMDALNNMIAAAKKEGITLTLRSGFRSYERQKTLYNNYVKQDGVAEADRYSARPGHSEHQSGLAFDLNSLEQSFGETAEGKWLAENCHKYGFIIRYPQGKENITGYMYEPWHVRYLGLPIAEAVHASGLCLEEFLSITSVYAN